MTTHPCPACASPYTYCPFVEALAPYWNVICYTCGVVSQIFEKQEEVEADQ